MSDLTSTPEPVNKYVAFCDILGFSSRVQDDFDKALAEYNAFLTFIAERDLFRDVEMSIYSDAVLITSNNFDEVVTAVNSLWFFAFHHNFLIRGGISYGRYWERRSDGHFFVVSDALEPV